MHLQKERNAGLIGMCGVPGMVTLDVDKVTCSDCEALHCLGFRPRRRREGT